MRQAAAVMILRPSSLTRHAWLPARRAPLKPILPTILHMSLPETGPG